MPVPVPRITKQPAHQVVKQRNHTGEIDHIHPSVFHSLTRTLPVSPTGPPPSFGTREEWISSLPSWRRTKPRRIWEDDVRLAEGRRVQNFPQGLTVAGNAPVIKGAHAQACIPPLFTLLQDSGMLPMMPLECPQGCESDMDDEMGSECSAPNQDSCDNESQWSAVSSFEQTTDRMIVEYQAESDAMNDGCAWGHGDMVVDNERPYERGAFTPVFEDESSDGHEVGSSPLGPVTPFGEFVDRAVAADQAYSVYNNLIVGRHDSQLYQGVVGCQLQYFPFPAKQVKEASEPVVTPTSNSMYRRLAEPLSQWLASYIWKVCTTGLSLPAMFARPSNDSFDRHSYDPPSYLAHSIQSLLLSTLLQPSAILLAVWYIVRLPVFFGAAPLSAEHADALKFRAELLGDESTGCNRESMEANAPFRLFLLGCMLANKWLDDHTFSNKTWHTISGVPILSLNRMESLALTIFHHDISVPSRQWSQWLAHLLSYHQALSPGIYPQPISRPSTNPHSVIRKAIEDLIEASSISAVVASPPKPVFVGLEQRKNEKSHSSETSTGNSFDAFEIDLDEDGPLREEYLPKRRVSGSTRNSTSAISGHQTLADWDISKVLPPPAKWSPSADEPIFRSRNRLSGQYVAVQAPLPFPTVPPYQASLEPSRYQSWIPGGMYIPGEQPGYYVNPVVFHAPVYNMGYPYMALPQTHTRSQSLRYSQEDHSRHHSRTYSQSRAQYKGNVHKTATEHGARADIPWVASEHHYLVEYGHPFATHNNKHLPSPWLRT